MAVLAYAAGPDTRPGCDPEYMDAIEARAWLQGERRITQNQNLIYKPDSVIEYSCFNQYIGYLADNPDGRRFSENHPEYPLWGRIGGIGERSLDLALFDIVTAPMLEYLAPSFGHTFLGGRTADAGGNPPEYGKYNCRAMSYVWKIARCQNFVENQDVDDFYDFPWYSSHDPRKYPEDYPACEPQTQRINSAMIEAYRGQGQDNQHGEEWHGFVLETENNPYIGENTKYEEDPMQTDSLMTLILPGNCGDSGVIPTGVQVNIPGQGEWQENFCTIPSCSYDGGACVQ